MKSFKNYRLAVVIILLLSFLLAEDYRVLEIPDFETFTFYPSKNYFGITGLYGNRDAASILFDRDGIKLFEFRKSEEGRAPSAIIPIEKH